MIVSEPTTSEAGAADSRVVTAEPSLKRRRPPTRPDISVVVLFTCAVFFLGMTWAISSPAPSGTDEAAHYVRALSVAAGELTGPRVPFPAHDSANPDAIFYWDQTTRAFQLPARIAPAQTFVCNASNATLPATCVAGTRCQRWAASCTGDPPTSGTVTIVSYTGNYEPTGYILPGLLAQLGNNDVNGLRLARMGAVLMMTALAALSAALLWDRGGRRYSLLGIFVAATPTAMYINGMLNPNGLEIMASITFMAALIRVWRDREATPRWVWIAAGVVGFVLGISRFLGSLWIIVDTLTIVGVIGVRPALRILRLAGRPAAFAVSAAFAGVVADEVWWQVVVGIPHSRRSLSLFTENITGQAQYLSTVFKEEIGNFGWGDVDMGSVGYIIWTVMALALVSVAFLVGTRRQRIVLGATISGALVFSVIVGSITRVEFGFEGPLLGRYQLPWSAGIALLAAEICAANMHRLGNLAPRNIILYVAGAAAVDQGIGLWMSARRFAVGVNGPLMFLGQSKWSPPFGWGPWIVSGMIGCSLLAATGVAALRSPPILRDRALISERQGLVG